MKFSKRLAHPRWCSGKALQSYLGLICVLAALVITVDGSTRRGDKVYKQAQKAEEDKDYDKALDLYQQALATDPKDAAYIMAEQRSRANAANWHIARGKQLVSQQKLNEGLVEFEGALLADPSSQIAVQKVRETTVMLKEKAQNPAAPVLTPAERARQEIENRINSLEGPPSLRPINDQIKSLKMNNQPVRVLYESVAKLAGINVLFDPQGIESVSGKNYNLDLTNVGLDEALNYIAMETHTFWKPISRNAIFVTQESEPKRQEYQDQIVKVFYIQNASTPAEFTEIFNAVRTGAKLTTGIFQVASQNAIVARGPVDTMAIVEKLVHDLDRPKPEVMVDVIVMEVSKTLTRTLGASLLGAGGLNTAINFTPRNSITVTTTSTSTGGDTSTSTSTSTSTATSGAVALNSLGHLSSGDFSTTLPGAMLQAMLSDNRAKILQRPQVRATDGGKASLKIGEKIPYVSGSLNSAVATAGSIPYATTQFQQIDVGVNVDLSPHVNGVNDVSMKIKVEISSNPNSKNIAGVDEPIIAQRVNEADIRMRDGEPAILGGLSELDNSNNVSGVPGITNVPVLGYLFSSKQRSRTDDQILIALVPHILRAPDLTTAGEPGVLAGSERVVRVARRPATGSNAPHPPANSRGPSGSVVNPGPGVPAGGVPQNRPFQQRNFPGDQNQQQQFEQQQPQDQPQEQPDQVQPQEAEPSAPPQR